MFNFLRKLFRKPAEPDIKFKAGEKVKYLSNFIRIPGKEKPTPVYCEATIVSHEIEPAKVWYKVKTEEHGIRTMHESYLKKARE